MGAIPSQYIWSTRDSVLYRGADSAPRWRNDPLVSDAPPSNKEECGTAPVPSLSDRPALIGSRTGSAISAPASAPEGAQEKRKTGGALRMSRYARVLLAFF